MLPSAPTPVVERETRGAVVTMLAASAFFALMALAVGLAHRQEAGLSTLASSTFRSVVNLVVLIAMAGGNVRALLGDRRPALLLRGVGGATALITYFAALPLVGVGEAAFLNNTSSVWVAVLAPLLLGERSRAGVWVAVAGSVVGTALLGLPREGHHDTLGRILGVVSGLSAAGAYLSVRRASASNPPRVIVFWFVLVSTTACGVLVALTPVQWPKAPLTWAMLLAAGLFATGGQLLMTRAYQLGPAAAMAAIASATPLFTALCGVAFLGERPDSWALLGMAVLFASAVALPLWQAREP